MRPRTTAHSQCISFLLAISLFLAACGPTITTASPVQPTLSPGPAAGWFKIYFTDPSAPHARDYEGGPDEALAATIDGARLSVDVAAYSLNLWSVRDALVHASQRGVLVRMVMESDNMDDQEVQDLIDAGIPIVGDQREGLMHDKFVVIDRSEVWTGSMNYTVGGAYKDNNNLIHIRSTQVAQDYIAEFEEMFNDNLFGPDTLANTPNPSLTIDSTPVEIYFSPDDGVALRLLELIGGAQESIYFMAFSFTSNDIGAAIVERAQAGVTVAGVMDSSQIASNQGTEYDTFAQAGLDVRQDGNTNGLMHHKVIIIDRQIVITGSYNFTASAEESNDENVVIIFSPAVAATYLEEFQRVYGQTQQP
jgi:phosphatidylserine/phosphatidylglycerophosphate/cardiolipin synthase-like enzyme